jgi:hypothetical protein
MRTSTSSSVAAVLLTVLLAAGCSSATDDAATSAWAGKLCGAYLSFRDAVAAAAPTSVPADHDEQVALLGTFAGTAATAAQGSVNEIGAAGVPDVDGAAALAAAFTQRMTLLQTTFATAQTRIGEAPDRDALEQAVAPLQSLSNLPDPTTDLITSADLRRGVDAAPNCQKLRSAG